MNTNLSDLYKIAKEHKDSHKGCGGEPYKNYAELFEFIKKINPENILELGTGIGFTAILLHLAAPFALVETLESNSEHVEIAKNWCRQYRNINIVSGDVYKILPFYESKSFEVLFFDVYGPKEEFLYDFERILKSGGYLVCANRHLKSAEANFFMKLENENVWKKINEFGDTIIYQKI